MKWLGTGCGFLAFCLVVHQPIAQAAEVSKLLSADIVELAVEEAEHFKPGDTVCFFNELNKPVACGVTLPTLGSLPQIRVRADFLLKLSPGMKARLSPAKGKKTSPSAGTQTTLGGPSTPEASHNKVQALNSSQKTPPATAHNSSTSSAWSINLGGMFIPQHLASFNTVSYQAPLDRSTTPVQLGKVSSLWNYEQQVKKSLASSYFLELSYESSYRYHLGVRTVQLGTYDYQSNYDLEKQPTDSTQLRNYAATVMTGEDYGLYLDISPLSFNMGNYTFELGSGVDFNQSIVSMTMQKIDETTGDRTTLTQYYSKIRSLSGRMISSLRYSWRRVELRLGFNILFPLHSTIEELITISDPQMAQFLSNGKQGEDDISENILHDSTQFSTQLHSSIGIRF